MLNQLLSRLKIIYNAPHALPRTTRLGHETNYPRYSFDIYREYRFVLAHFFDYLEV